MLSQGQFVGCDITKSIEEFSNLIATKFNWSYLFSNIYVQFLLWTNDSVITQYKKGFISTENFVNSLISILSLEENDAESVKAAWNRMCEISPEKKKEISAIAKSQVDVLIVSYSNELHREYISQQLNNIFSENNLPNYESNSHFLIYSPKTPTVVAIEDLTCEAISRFGLNENKFNTVIYSLNKYVNNDSCKGLYVDIRNYNYEDFTGKLHLTGSEDNYPI